MILVTEQDAHGEGLDAKALAYRWAGAIREGLELVVRQHSWLSLWRRIGITVLVLIVGFLLLWAVRWGWRRVTGYLEARRDKITALRFRSLQIISREHVFYGISRTLWLVFGLALLLVVTGTLLLVFSQFPQTSDYARVVFYWIWKPFVDLVRGIVHLLPN